MLRRLTKVNEMSQALVFVSQNALAHMVVETVSR